MGQPFAGEIDLINIARDDLSTLKVALAPPSAYEAANLRYDPALNALRLSVERRPNGAAYIRATSFRRVNEPYLDLLVDLVSQDGRFRRGYAALLDPPDVNDSAAATTKAGVAPSPTIAAGPVTRAELAPPARPPAPRARRQPVAPAATPVPTTPSPAAAASSAAATATPPIASTVQRTPAATPATATPAPASVPAPSDAKSAEPVKTDEAKAAPAEAVTAAPPSTATTDAQNAPTPAAAPAEARTANQPAPKPGLLDSLGDYLMPIGGILLALLAGLAALWALRRNQSTNDPLPEPETRVAPVVTSPRNDQTRAGPPVAAVLPASAAVTAPPKASSDDTPPEHTVASVSDMVDPVEEAMVYLNHSQDETAEKILRETLSKQPGREDALMMLLEILAQRGDTESFNQLAGRLHKQTGGLGTNWKRAMAMGFALDPGYPLYSPSGSTPAQPARVQTTESEGVRAAPEADDLGNTIDINLSRTDVGVDLDKTMVLPYAASKPPAPPAAPLPDINFELPAASKPAAPVAPDTPAVPASKDVPPLDFKIDLPAFGDKPARDSAAAAQAARDEHWDNVQQKLDLARAYREMGDRDGAMELLEEVSREGDPAQQADARQIIESFK